MTTKFFASCDTAYFTQHGVAFCNSVITANARARVVVFPTLGSDPFLQHQQFAKACEHIIPNPNLEIEFVDQALFIHLLDNVHVQEARAFYACMRFLLLPYIYTTEPYLTVDIDSIIKAPVTIDSKYEVGLFLREDNQTGGTEYEVNGMKVAAGLVYTTPASKKFVTNVAAWMYLKPLQWFVDQHALYNAYKQCEYDTTNKDKLLRFDGATLDWEFKEGTPIWTGKGARKFENETYLNEKKKHNGKEKTNPKA